jgi:hypothetical protein
LVLWKNPEHLTVRQRGTFARIADVNRRLYRACLLNEELRLVFKLKSARAVASGWLDSSDVYLIVPPRSWWRLVGLLWRADPCCAGASCRPQAPLTTSEQGPASTITNITLVVLKWMPSP